ADRARGVEDLLRPHLDNDVGVRADIEPGGAQLTQQAIKLRAVTSSLYRINADQNGIKLQGLLAQLRYHRLVKRKLNASSLRGSLKRREHPVVVVLSKRRGSARIAPGQNPYL